MTATSPVFAWLRAGVPISLLVDLAEPAGPDSREIARVEGVSSGPVPDRRAAAG